MSAQDDSTAGVGRRVIPRWRPFRLTAALGELDSSGEAVPQVEHPGGESGAEFRALVEAWEKHRSLSFAADLVGAATVRGNPEPAIEAAQFIVSLGDSAPAGARTLASSVLSTTSATAPTIDDDVTEARAVADERALRVQVAALRNKLREGPRNAPLWVDLARTYTLLGQQEPAVQAMRRALALAPESRFVLRSAARLFLHTSEPERAYSLLRLAPATPYDPWLLAAEIAVASRLERGPRYMREGRRELERRAMPPKHLSELATAIGTLELLDGRARHARQRFRVALQRPTENAVAQAVWASQRDAALIVRPADLTQPRSFEARAEEHRLKAEWEDALVEASRWFADEPFSRRAGAFASYIASVPLERYDVAERITRQSLRGRPYDPLLLNNLAFALASSGQIDEAEQEFSRIPADAFQSPGYRAMLLATRGLLLYRRGLLEMGRIHYEQAIDEARKQNSPLTVALASLFHAREATLAGAEYAHEIRKAAQAETERVKEREVAAVSTRLPEGGRK